MHSRRGNGHYKSEILSLPPLSLAVSAAGDAALAGLPPRPSDIGGACLHAAASAPVCDNLLSIRNLPTMPAVATSFSRFRPVQQLCGGAAISQSSLPPALRTRLFTFSPSGATQSRTARS